MTVIVNDNEERIQSILNGEDVIFEISGNPTANPSYGESYRFNGAGELAIATFNLLIEQQALEQQVDVNLVRSIMFIENSQGFYNVFIPDFLEDSQQPMNINPDIWGGLVETGADFNDPETNIRAGVALIKAISDRLLPEDRTPENIGSIYLFTGRETVSD